MKTQFRALTKVYRRGPFAASFVELPIGIEYQTPLVISIGRVAGNAVERNRVKRQVKGFFLTNQSESILKWPIVQDPTSQKNAALWIRFSRHQKISKLNSSALRQHLEALTRDLNRGK